MAIQISGISSKNFPFESSSLTEPAKAPKNTEATKPNNGPLSFEKLPHFVRGVLFSYVAGAGKPEDAQMFCAARLVSKSWLAFADKHILSVYWNKLTETKLPQLQFLVQQVDQESKLEEAAQSSPNAVEKCSQVNWKRFTGLSEEFQKRGAFNSLDRPILGVLPTGYEQMQRQMDASLIIIWGKVQKKINFNRAQAPQSAHEIRMWLNDSANAKQINHITHLDLSNLRLTVLPPEIGNFHQLTELNLAQNQLTGLPETIGNLNQLTELNLGYNRLTSLLETIGNLNQLKKLDLSCNQLRSLPEIIGNLNQLIELELPFNGLRSLPETIGNLNQLIKLDLGYNKLRSLPETIGNLTQLEELYIEHNQLRSLPETISNLTQLEEVVFNNNQLTSSSETIVNLSKLISYYDK